MGSRTVRWMAVVGLLAGGACLGGCSEQARVERYRAQAERAMRDGEVAEATQALEEAHRAARKDEKLRGELAAVVAALHAEQGQWSDAEPYAREAVALGEKTLGTYELETGRRHLQLGNILLRQDQLEPAAASLTRALQVLQRAMASTVAPGDVLYAGALLGSIRSRQGRFEEAEKIARQGLELRTADASAKAGAWGVLADVYRDWDRLPEAVAASREAVRVVGEGKGLAMAGVLNNLAWMLALNGEGAEAEKTARRAVQLTEEANGSLPQLSGHLDTLALALLANGKPAEAEAIARKALERGEKGKLGAATLAFEHGTLARILAAQQRVADAEAEFQLGVKLAEKKHPTLEVARLLEAYARFLEGQGRGAESAPLASHAQAIRKPADAVPPAPAGTSKPAENAQP